MASPGSDRCRDAGLLLLRVGIGAMFVVHGWPKITNPEMWEKLGGATAAVGFTFAPKAFGFLAALAEFGGGICLALGILFRPAAAMMLCTMIVATSMHLAKGDGFAKASHAIEAGILFASLILIGPGRYALGAVCCGKKGAEPGK